MFDLGLTSAFPSDTVVFRCCETGARRPAETRSRSTDSVRLDIQRNPALLPRTLATHPGCRVATLIRLNVAGTRITVPSPPMEAQFLVGTDVVASTPDGFLHGNPSWRRTGGHLGTSVANPLPLRCRFRLGRSNGLVERWILVVERHLSLPIGGRSSALIRHPHGTSGTTSDRDFPLPMSRNPAGEYPYQLKPSSSTDV